MKEYKALLLEYLPEPAVPKILHWLVNWNVQLKISRSRNSKLGDYRPPIEYKFHRISVNYDLNKYHFLITLVHEFAHLKVWEKHQRNARPHGIEWKNSFSGLMQEFMNSDVFPDDLLTVLKSYLINPTSSTSNSKLLSVLRNYDENKNYLVLEDLPISSIFRTENGFVFQKMETLRKRIKCKRLDNNRLYLANPLIKAEPVVN